MSAVEIPIPTSPHQETVDLYLAEHLPVSELQHSLREERAAQLYERMESTANSILTESEINTVHELVWWRDRVTDPREQVYEGGRTATTLGNLSLPSVNKLMQNLADFASDGLRIKQDISSPPNDEERIYTLTPNLELGVEYRYGSSISFRLQPSSTEGAAEAEKDAKELVVFLAEQDAQASGFRSQIKQKIQNGENEAFADQALTFEKDDIELRAFLQGSNLNLNSDGDRLNLKSHGYKQLIEKLYELPSHYRNESQAVTDSNVGIYFTENGAVDRVVLGTYREGVNIVLKNADPTNAGDLSELQLIPGITLDLAGEYNRTQDGNNKYREGTRPFLETPTAAELLVSFEKAGVKPNHRLRDCFLELDQMDKRYGQGYADLTRELGKLVNDPARNLSRAFEGEDEFAIKTAIAQLEDATDPAAQVVVEMLRGIVTRDATEASGVVLKSSKERIELKDGSCKDAEVYIVTGSTPYNDAEEVPLFKDPSYNTPSTLTLRPTVLNGVKIPAGSLLAKRKDGYLLMRVTSFAFTPEEAAMVFGAQDAENRSWSFSYEYMAEDIRAAIEHLKELD